MDYDAYIESILTKRGRKITEPVYKEKHHITPRCLNGSNDESNLIELLYPEHVEAHRLLMEKYPEVPTLKCAYGAMSGQWVKGKDNPFYGAKHTQESKELIRQAQLSNWKDNTQRKAELSERVRSRKVSDETREKMSKNHADFRGKNGTTYGMKWYTNDIINLYLRPNEPVPKGFRPGHIGFSSSETLKSTWRKISQALMGNNRGKHWYNNGVYNIRDYECPEGFEPGKLNYKGGD